MSEQVAQARARVRKPSPYASKGTTDTSTHFRGNARLRMHLFESDEFDNQVTLCLSQDNDGIYTALTMSWDQVAQLADFFERAMEALREEEEVGGLVDFSNYAET